MALNVGDKCPQCKVGLLERTEMGLTCSDCDYDEEIGEVVRAQETAKVTQGKYKFRAARIGIRIASPEDGEEFLKGVILARQNNNSELFVELIEAVNELLQPYRAARLEEEMKARAEAGMA